MGVSLEVEIWDAEYAKRIRRDNLNKFIAPEMALLVEILYAKQILSCQDIEEILYEALAINTLSIQSDRVRVIDDAWK